MYFTECANLAERHPDLAGIVQQIDAQLREMGTAEVVRVEDFASFLGGDPNQVLSVFEMLAQDGLLLGEEMIECPHCRTAVLRSEYEGVLNEEGAFRCTDCDRPLPQATVQIITTYRRGKQWKESLKPKEVSDATGFKECPATARGPFYLAVMIKETVFDAEAPEASLESACEESRDYFYRVEEREIALKLLGLFDKKLGEDTASIGKATQVQFALAAASKMDETDRFLIDQEIDKLATEVSGYAAQWMVDCLELGEPPWVHDPNNPPLCNEDRPLSAMSLHHRAEQWEEALKPSEDSGDVGHRTAKDIKSAPVKEWPDPTQHTTAKVWTTKDGSLWMSTKTDGGHDGKVEFSLREDGNPTYQMQFMRLICFRHPKPVLLREVMEEVYPKECATMGGDPRNLLRKVRSLVSDIRTKKLAKANLNQDILPPLSIESSMKTGISLRLAKLHRLDDKGDDILPLH